MNTQRGAGGWEEKGIVKHMKNEMKRNETEMRASDGNGKSWKYKYKNHTRATHITKSSWFSSMMLCKKTCGFEFRFRFSIRAAPKNEKFQILFELFIWRWLTTFYVVKFNFFSKFCFHFGLTISVRHVVPVRIWQTNSLLPMMWCFETRTSTNDFVHFAQLILFVT